LTQWQSERALVLETSLKLVEKGLVAGKAGNVSMRVPKGRVPQGAGPDLLAITPTSRYYDTLAVEDIPVLDFDGRVVAGKLPPSSELKLHIAIYRARADVAAVIHTHSVHASVIAVCGTGIPAILEEEVATLGGEVRVASFAASGSEQLARNAVEALGDRSAVVLAHHGGLGVGRTLREALDACELLEKAARVYLLALATGTVNLLPAEAVAAAQSAFRRVKMHSDP
jgi:ribulose-5-phosphate 4-epimerase/fuculose-1-phosphate aldolase